MLCLIMASQFLPVGGEPAGPKTEFNEFRVVVDYGAEASRLPFFFIVEILECGLSKADGGDGYRYKDAFGVLTQTDPTPL